VSPYPRYTTESPPDEHSSEVTREPQSPTQSDSPIVPFQPALPAEQAHLQETIRIINSDMSFCNRDCFCRFVKIVFCFGISNNAVSDKTKNQPAGGSSNNELPAGDAKDELQAGGPKNEPYSGYVGSIVLAIVMICISSSQEMAMYVSDDHPQFFVQIVNSIYILLAIGVLIVLKWTKTGRHSDDEIETGRPNEAVLAMGLFWAFGAVLDIWEVSYIANCALEMIEIENASLIALTIDIFYHSIRPIFKLVLVIF